MKHVPEGDGINFRKYTEGGTASVFCKGDPTKSGYLISDPNRISTINWKILYQDTESSKASRGKTNKSTKAILEMPQET